MSPTVLFVLLFIKNIGGVKTYWQKLQSERGFCDVALVCDGGHLKTHKFIISSCSPFRNIHNEVWIMKDSFTKFDEKTFILNSFIMNIFSNNFENGDKSKNIFSDNIENGDKSKKNFILKLLF